MELRPGLPEDIPQIAAIYRDAVLHGRGSFEIDPPDEAEMAARQAVLLAGGFPYLVMTHGDREIAGYGYAGPYRPRPAYRNTLEDSVYVAAARRGSGVGHRLLGAILEAATAGGYRQMIAVIGDSANTPSIRLHAALGFQPAGVLRAVGWKHGLWLDTVLMQRPLGPGAAAPGHLPPPP